MTKLNSGLGGRVRYLIRLTVLLELFLTPKLTLPRVVGLVAWHLMSSPWW